VRTNALGAAKVKENATVQSQISVANQINSTKKWSATLSNYLGEGPPMSWSIATARHKRPDIGFIELAAPLVWTSTFARHWPLAAEGGADHLA
jgi:hypothetical protein